MDMLNNMSTLVRQLFMVSRIVWCKLLTCDSETISICIWNFSDLLLEPLDFFS